MKKNKRSYLDYLVKQLNDPIEIEKLKSIDFSSYKFKDYLVYLLKKLK